MAGAIGWTPTRLLVLAGPRLPPAHAGPPPPPLPMLRPFWPTPSRPPWPTHRNVERESSFGYAPSTRDPQDKAGALERPHPHISGEICAPQRHSLPTAPVPTAPPQTAHSTLACPPPHPHPTPTPPWTTPPSRAGGALDTMGTHSQHPSPRPPPLSLVHPAGMPRDVTSRLTQLRRLSEGGGATGLRPGGHGQGPRHHPSTTFFLLLQRSSVASLNAGFRLWPCRYLAVWRSILAGPHMCAAPTAC